jgi:hypothetical protein
MLTLVGNMLGDLCQKIERAIAACGMTHSPVGETGETLQVPAAQKPATCNLDFPTVIWYIFL